MFSDHIHIFVKKKMDEGKTRSQIREILKVMGLTDAEIENAFKEVEKNNRKPASEIEQEDFTTSLEAPAQTKSTSDSHGKPFGSRVLSLEELAKDEPKPNPEDLPIMQDSTGKPPSAPAQTPPAPKKPEHPVQTPQPMTSAQPKPVQPQQTTPVQKPVQPAPKQPETPDYFSDDSLSKSLEKLQAEISSSQLGPQPTQPTAPAKKEPPKLAEPIQKSPETKSRAPAQKPLRPTVSTDDQEALTLDLSSEPDEVLSIGYIGETNVPKQVPAEKKQEPTTPSTQPAQQEKTPEQVYKDYMIPPKTSSKIDTVEPKTDTTPPAPKRTLPLPAKKIPTPQTTQPTPTQTREPQPVKKTPQPNPTVQPTPTVQSTPTVQPTPTPIQKPVQTKAQPVYQTPTPAKKTSDGAPKIIEMEGKAPSLMDNIRKKASSQANSFKKKVGPKREEPLSKRSHSRIAEAKSRAPRKTSSKIVEDEPFRGLDKKKKTPGLGSKKFIIIGVVLVLLLGVIGFLFFFFIGSPNGDNGSDMPKPEPQLQSIDITCDPNDGPGGSLSIENKAQNTLNSNKLTLIIGETAYTLPEVSLQPGDSAAFGSDQLSVTLAQGTEGVIFGDDVTVENFEC